MIIVGLEGCESCKILKQKHPHLQYIEIPLKRGVAFNETLYNIKKMLGKHGYDQFPVLMEDDLSEFIPMKKLDPEFAKEYWKLY